MSHWNRQQLADELSRLANCHGGKILSPYTGCNKPLLCECAVGHRFKMTPTRIKKGRWCRLCAAAANASKTRHSREKITILASATIRGICLSSEYKSAHEPLRWKCSEGHEFARFYTNLRMNRCCPECEKIARREALRRRVYAKVSVIVSKKGGTLLTSIIEGWQSRFEVVCKEGHRWLSTAGQIRVNWCQKCHMASMVANREYNKRKSIEAFQQLAEKKGGRCLSEEYDGAEGMLTFDCGKGHRTFKLRASNAFAGVWCKRCADDQNSEAQRTSIEEIRVLAASRGGTCLSPAYTRDMKKLRWQCHRGHEWDASFSKIKYGQWCPACSAGLGERICRAFFEQLFRRKFSKVQPPWLRTVRKTWMELDGYCNELQLAFEHQGRQHYGLTPLFSTSPEKLAKRQEMDEEKKQLCLSHGITLISVPEIPTLVRLSEVKALIRRECERANFSVPKDFDSVVVDLRSAYAGGKYSRTARRVEGGRSIQVEMRLDSPLPN